MGLLLDSRESCTHKGVCVCKEVWVLVDVCKLCVSKGVSDEKGVRMCVCFGDPKRLIK